MIPAIRQSIRKTYNKQTVYKEVRNLSFSKIRKCKLELKEKSASALQPAESTPKPNLRPFAKDLFLGRFNSDILVFPEVLNKEALEKLDETVAPIEKFFEEHVDSALIDKEAQIPVETLQGLKNLGLFGQQIPVEYGGLGLNATEYTRLAEILALDGSIAYTLTAHEALGLKGILIDGNYEQKKTYLPQLSTGEKVAAFCLTEPSCGSDAASIQTRATLSQDGQTWNITGSKIWISNGGIADVFTVFAQTELEDHTGKMVDRVTAFIVEREFGGVSSGNPEDKLGIRGLNTCEVSFNNTPVPAQNVLGEVGEGFKVALNIMNSGRFSMGSAGAGILKKLIKWTTEHAVNRHQFQKPLKDFGMIQEKFARMALITYAMESMAYLTAGMLDGYENPDCSVESAIVKVYSSEGVWQCTDKCLQILGGLGYMKEYPYERYLRDSRNLMIFEGTNEILRLFISLTGLQHAGQEIKDEVKKVRNPLMNPSHIIKKLIRNRKQYNDNPKLNLHLWEYLHPSLDASARELEYAVLRFQYGVEVALFHHGAIITDHQMELRRIANIVTDIYAMTAVLARASRSYCIGLRNADHEILLASTFCREACARVKSTVKELELGQFLSGDKHYSDIANKMFESGGYCAEHPLKRTFF